MNEKGLALIKRFEGKRLKAYIDPVGIWTIGYGHTSAAGGPKVTRGLTITDNDAEVILMRDLQQYEAAVDRLVTVPLNENQRSALTSFTYNVGIGGLKKSSALRELNKGNYADVPRRLALWSKGRVNGKLTVLKGLERRRKAEGDLFMEPVASTSPKQDAPARRVSKPLAGAIIGGTALVAGFWDWIASFIERIFSWIF